MCHLQHSHTFSFHTVFTIPYQYYRAFKISALSLYLYLSIYISISLYISIYIFIYISIDIYIFFFFFKKRTGYSSQRVGRTKGLSFSLGSAANKRCSLGLSLKFDGQTFFHLHNQEG